MADENSRLVFVYNADSGLFNTLKDITHKIVSPETYECHLCALTHGALRMHGEWRDVIAQLPHPMVFLHRDEARARYAISAELPAVYLESAAGLQLLVTAAAINACVSIDELKQQLFERLGMPVSS